MTLYEMVKYLRRNILDDKGGQGANWSDSTESTRDSIQLRWNNEDLVANINEAILQVFRRINPIKDRYTLPLIANTNSYDLPSYIKTIELVRRQSDGHSLRKRELEELWRLGELETRKDQPTDYIVDGNTGTITIFPIPVDNDELEMIVYRLPLKKLTWEDDQDTIPELNEDYHVPTLYYAAYLCYSLDEANTIDPKRASNFLAMFDREFPFTSAYSNVRKSRTSNRPVRYGGL